MLFFLIELIHTKDSFTIQKSFTNQINALTFESQNRRGFEINKMSEAHFLGSDIIRIGDLFFKLSITVLSSILTLIQAKI